MMAKPKVGIQPGAGFGQRHLCSYLKANDGTIDPSLIANKAEHCLEAGACHFTVKSQGEGRLD